MLSDKLNTIHAPHPCLEQHCRNVELLGDRSENEATKNQNEKG
jgi:hypothetical protein